MCIFWTHFARKWCTSNLLYVKLNEGKISAIYQRYYKIMLSKEILNIKTNNNIFEFIHQWSLWEAINCFQNHLTAKHTVVSEVSSVVSVILYCRERHGSFVFYHSNILLWSLQWLLEPQRIHSILQSDGQQTILHYYIKGGTHQSYICCKCMWFCLFR